MLLKEEETTWGETQHSTAFWVHSRSYGANEKLDPQKKFFFACGGGFAEYNRAVTAQLWKGIAKEGEETS